MDKITTDVKQNLIDFVKEAQEVGMTKDHAIFMLSKEWDDLIKQKKYGIFLEELNEPNLRRKVKRFFERYYEDFDTFGYSLKRNFMSENKFFKCPTAYYSNWCCLTNRPRNGKAVLNEQEKVLLVIEVAVAISSSSIENISKTEYINEIVSKVNDSIGFQLKSKKGQCILVADVLFRYIEQYELEGWKTENNILDLSKKFMVMLNNS